MSGRSIRVSENAYAKLQEWKLPIESDETQAIMRMAAAAEKRAKRKRRLKGGQDLISQSGRVPHGTKLRARYKGRQYDAEVRDGAVAWGDDRFKSLSAAAVAVIQSTGSNRPTENGWRFWEYLDTDSEQWKSCKMLQEGQW